MKVRSGFVSNSSSSSFIVGFKSVPETIGQMLDALFPDGKKVIACEYSDDKTLSTLDVAEIVLKDLDPNVEIDRDGAIEMLMVGDFPGLGCWLFPMERLNDLNREFREKYGEDANPRDYDDWIAAERKIRNETKEENDRRKLTAAEKYLDTEWQKFAGLHVFSFIYSDDDASFGCVMEHGRIFRNLPHIQISLH